MNSYLFMVELGPNSDQVELMASHLDNNES